MDVGDTAPPPESPDRPVLMGAMQALAAAVRPKVEAVASAATAAVDSALGEAELVAATIRSEAVLAKEAQAASIAPWQTLGEQFSILEDELRVRIFRIALTEANFSKETAMRRRRDGNILPGCSGMANAALLGDDALRALRFKLVPGRLSEEEFWRSYFWHVANVKCELLHDWRTANTMRREAAMEEEMALSAEDDGSAGATTVSGAALDVVLPGAADGVCADDLDEEFERLVASPSP